MTVPVRPLGKLGSRLGRRTKVGLNTTKEGCKTYQKLAIGGAKLNETDLRNLQT